MGEGKGRLWCTCCGGSELSGLGFAIAAERQRSGEIRTDVQTNKLLRRFLVSSLRESLLMGVTKCMCFGRPLAPGGNRAWSIIYFFHHACLIAGATKNAITPSTGMIYAQNFSCEALRKGFSFLEQYLWLRL
ncbi:hypothetical protein D8674_015947 [Pyrus ussuriensis x Pyrus communis]|uniref:Uncharacterized protein n=1 Tax=Pyrus ussuriensis x Pyrus communis TaxID=2448454 RepID=A0A5N5HBJ2_9ROSA|nr:hypothetical protein D8674_015947 [Pyrus ussuriensis x Pyrus communis]